MYPHLYRPSASGFHFLANHSPLSLPYHCSVFQPKTYIHRRPTRSQPQYRHTRAPRPTNSRCRRRRLAARGRERTAEPLCCRLQRRLLVLLACSLAEIVPYETLEWMRSRPALPIEAIVLASTPSFSRHSGAREVNVSLPPLSNSAGNYSPHGALCTPEWENPSWVEFSEDKVFVIRLDDFLLSWSVPWGGEMRACGIPFAPSGLFWGEREKKHFYRVAHNLTTRIFLLRGCSSVPAFSFVSLSVLYCSYVCSYSALCAWNRESFDVLSILELYERFAFSVFLWKLHDFYGSIITCYTYSWINYYWSHDFARSYRTFDVWYSFYNRNYYLTKTVWVVRCVSQ